MNRRYILLLSCLFSAFLFQRCDDKCGKKAAIQERIVRYEYRQVFRLRQRVMTDQRFDSVTVATGDTFFLSFSDVRERISAAGQGSGFSLMACDPVFPQTEVLGDSLSITALDDVGTGHPAGSPLNDVALLLNTNAWYQGSPDDLFFRPVEDFKTLNSNSYLYIGLVLNPDPGSVRFRLSIFSVNRTKVYTFDTPPIHFN